MNQIGKCYHNTKLNSKEKTSFKHKTNFNVMRKIDTQ